MYTLRGVKRWVTNGSQAGVFTVFANVEMSDENGQKRPFLTAFLVDKDTKGVQINANEGPHVNRLGMKGLDVATVTFKYAMKQAIHAANYNSLRNVEVPGSRVLGERGKGMAVYNEMMQEGRAILGARIAALLRTLFDTMIP